MTLSTLTIPDDPAELPHWLERRLMAPDFGRFVSELSAHFPAKPDTVTPRHLFDRWLPVALKDGLDAIPSDVIHRFLKDPVALAALQERVATDGGAYWDEVTERSDDLTGAFARGKLALERTFSGGTSTPNGSTVPKMLVKRTAGRGYKTWAIVSTSVAACLALAVGLLVVRGPGESPIPKAQIAWGWGKPSGLATDGSNAKNYLNKLADNAEEWSLHQPNDSAGVGIRIAELRIGCTRLMHSSYGPLTAAEKAWLLEQCRAWAKILDGHQQSLDGGMDPLAVRAEVDETVRAIAATLRDKAKRLA